MSDEMEAQEGLLSSITHAPPTSAAHPQALSHTSPVARSVAAIRSSIQPVGARAHDAASPCQRVGVIAVLHFACARGPFHGDLQTTTRRRPCEKANIGERISLATDEIVCPRSDPDHMLESQ